jgi:prepilin-type N-terminal cleavage/methylation domain-containing protein
MPAPVPRNHNNNYGFTLIELSIVLVIIGLIVGGVLVGKDLIKAAAIRAQISQVEKYQTAVNTFKLKYGYPPGDMPDKEALAFGFARNCAFLVPCSNGNGVVNGAETGGELDATVVVTADQQNESHVFWTDLNTAQLIAETIKASFPCNTTTTNVSSYLPPARIGDGKYIYVWSGGVRFGQFIPRNNRKLYFAVAGIAELRGCNTGGFTSQPTLKVADAFAIDSKTDDGLPQSGKITATYIGPWGGCCNTARYVGASANIPIVAGWATGVGSPTTAAVPVSATTCYDNNNIAGQKQQYSMSQNSGDNETCAISFEQ